jgi:aspartokinase-like uncharacterized kinase
VKVGGSLYDLPDLGPRLQRWLAAEIHSPAVLVPGGGATTDVVRELDRRHALGEERAHWLALRALSLNAHFLAALLPGAAVIEEPTDFGADQPAVVILDAHAFLSRDEGRHGAILPHAWAVSSDSVAARAAVVAGAARLILLKSVGVPGGLNWDEAGQRCLVDLTFAAVLRAAPRLEVRVVNFRQGRW